ncbi:glutathione peroxidase [Lepidopterella palustris CBS 459.81]|uniref:Glutathione peroxidase n=1 Tax=Lepidopterella palustris CBS 459.81 TaxID=1314670 RepID=A0A8E2JK58_9PEZI|nr:glutathione peroxidase [Lepidopterella palustris CBS 459.81]
MQGARVLFQLSAVALKITPKRLFTTSFRLYRNRFRTSFGFYSISIRPLNSTTTTVRGKGQLFTTKIMASATSFYDFKPKDKKGDEYPLAQLKGKVILIVNTASKCGFTPQFAGLEKLYKDISTAHPDFTILGFPCNQFGGQDPGSNDEIQSFCQINYGVSFPVLGKIDVNGANAEPLYEWLKSEKPGLMGLKRVKWNFEKFLIGRDGQVKGRWASTTKPEALKEAVEKELAVKPVEA